MGGSWKGFKDWPISHHDLNVHQKIRFFFSSPAEIFFLDPKNSPYQVLAFKKN